MSGSQIVPCGSLGFDSALAGNPQRSPELAGTGFPPSPHPGISLIRNSEVEETAHALSARRQGGISAELLFTQ